jgi:hypothetical protein
MPHVVTSGKKPATVSTITIRMYDTGGPLSTPKPTKKAGQS